MNKSHFLDPHFEALDRISPEESWTSGDFVTAACLLEASAPKAGNVHPGASFDDMDFQDFRRSAFLVGEVFDGNHTLSCGSLILLAVQATRDRVGKNTNLGIILLLAPLIIAARSLSSETASSFRSRWKRKLSETLVALTADDSSMIYKAISIAKPGGLGQVEQMDIQQTPPEDFLIAMRMAAELDDIAKQYTTDFDDIFRLSEQLDAYCKEDLGWFNALCRVQLERLASHGDSLIARKNTLDLVDEVKNRAGIVLRSSSLARRDLVFQPEWKQFDEFLRADGHRRNPGTTADLLAAAILVSLMCTVQCS